ncbi:MAG: PQQ-binding-like beta-propeller repeat protein, partial [Pseudohongiellaceae bacterium]
MSSIQNLLMILVSVSLTLSVANAQPAGIDWPQYRGDESGSGYSSLDQLNRDNVSELTLAWSYSLRSDAADAREPNSQATPIMVNNVMYVPAGDRIVALDPVSGMELWRHTVIGDPPSRRGVSYWPGNDTVAPRLMYTSGNFLVAINAASGAISEDFGQGGSVNLGIPYNSVPLVHEDVVIVGANTPRGASGGIGNPRAYHARSGAKLWEFDA